MLSKMNFQWKFAFVTSMCTNIAVSSRITAIATHRPGWRTGTARMGSGRSVRGSASVVVMTSDARVDLRRRDRPLRDTPLVEDLAVGAVRDDRLQRTEDGLVEALRVLREHVPVGRGVVDVAQQLQLAVGLLDGVGAD